LGLELRLEHRPDRRDAADVALWSTVKKIRPAREVVSDFMGTPEDGARERSLCEKIYVWWGADDEGVYSLSERGQSETREFERTFRR
jgi:hypothetical protein